jgi:internalin A
VDDRKEDTDFYYWLQVVELLGENSPLLIVKNEKQNRRNLPDPELRKEFGEFLKAIISANLADNRGLEDIKKQICHYITSLPHVGEKLPKTWIRVRTALESDPRNYISLQEYYAICTTHGFTLEKHKLQLSEHLHDLGTCLHFQNDPLLNKTIILKPNWATNAVYRVLDNPKVRDETFGKFTTQDLKTIWSDPSYSPVREELLQLMKKFQLCYDIPNTPNTFIAPRLLPTEPPRYDWDNNENLLLRFSYDFMPKGILSRLIVAMHKLIEAQTLVWRTGVVLKDKSTRAEIVEYYNKKEIHIRICGDRKRDLMVIINHELQKIHDTFNRNSKHLKFNVHVPCICPQCLHNQDPHFFTLENLQNRRASREKDAHSVQCERSYKRISVFQITDDFPISQYQNIKPEVTMSQDPKITNTFHNTTIANFANEVKDNARQQAHQHIHQAPNQNLTQAAKEIKDLLDQLDKQYDRATPVGQAMINVKAIESIENNPQLKDRVTNAIKEGSITALEEAINHPVAKVIIATIKGFTDA